MEFCLLLANGATVLSSCLHGAEAQDLPCTLTATAGVPYGTHCYTWSRWCVESAGLDQQDWAVRQQVFFLRTVATKQPYGMFATALSWSKWFAWTQCQFWGGPKCFIVVLTINSHFLFGWSVPVPHNSEGTVSCGLQRSHHPKTVFLHKPHWNEWDLHKSITVVATSVGLVMRISQCIVPLTIMPPQEIVQKPLGVRYPLNSEKEYITSFSN